MQDLQNRLLAAVADAERDVLLAHVRDNPSMTLAEFGRILAAPPFRHLGGLKVGEVLGDLFTPTKAPAGRAASRAAALPRRSQQTTTEAARAVQPRRQRSKESEAFESGEDTVDTSSAEGRKEYDARVLSAVRERKSWVRSEELRPVVGGTGAQLGAALTRLCSNGDLTWTGRARGTRYAVPQPA